MGAFLAGTGSVMVKDGMDWGGGNGGVISCIMTDVTTLKVWLLEHCFVWTLCFQDESSQSMICFVGLSATMLCPDNFVTDTLLCPDSIL